MDIQTVIAAFIILGALLYAGGLIRNKIKAFQPKTASCGADCGCDASGRPKSRRS
ncbi:MAG TPA: hypothetical protein VIL74_06165 [Pyrinomonadaceae bacterium]